MIHTNNRTVFMRRIFSFAQRLLERIFTKKALAPQEKLFINVLREYIDDRTLKRQLASETKKKYNFYFKNVEAYFTHDLKLSELRIPMFEDLRTWLHGNLKSCGLTHSSRHLEICVSAMDYAVRMEYIKYNPLSALETGRDKRKTVVHLTKQELQKFMTYKFRNTTYNKVQDLYTFQAVTGLSYCDLYSYNTVTDTETGIEWIEDKRNKTGKTYFVPLSAPGFEIAKALHKKYEGHLPKMENGSYNRYLKEMANILEINKTLTTHTGRKTCATLLDQEGFSLGVIAAILGNSEEICRNHYINPSKKKVAKEISEKHQTRIINAALSN